MAARATQVRVLFLTIRFGRKSGRLSQSQIPVSEGDNGSQIGQSGEKEGKGGACAYKKTVRICHAHDAIQIGHSSACVRGS